MKRRLSKFCTLLVVIVSILGCSNDDDEVIIYNILTTKVYATDKGVGVINMESSYPGYNFSSMEVVIQPSAGVLRKVDEFLKYIPNNTSVADKFSIKLKGDAGNAMIDAEIIPLTAPKCDHEPLTYFTTSRGSTISIDLFGNKDFCDFTGTGSTGVCMKEGMNPEGNAAEVDVSNFQTYRVFTFSPNESFTGRYSFQYVLFVAKPNSTGDLCTDPSSSTHYSKHEVVIDVN